MSTEKTAYKTCMEMLEQRGFEIIVKEDSTLRALKPTGELIVVFFHNNSKLNKNDMGKYMTMMKDENCKHSIIIYMNDITSMSSKSVDQSVEMKIELFTFEELQFNITKHCLQPSKFVKLSADENLQFKRAYGTKFPIMKSSDPISRFYDYDKGDVIEITHKSGLVSHRIVF